MTGTALAQVISFALSPVISRLFSPSDFGVLGSFSAVSTVLAAAVTLDYSQAIMLPKEDADAIGLLGLSCVSTALIGVCCASLCLLVPNVAKGLLKSSGNWTLVLLVIGVVVNGINQTCQAWCVRIKGFKTTSASQIVRSASSNGMQTALGYLTGGPFVLAFSTVAGDLLATINLAKVVFRNVSGQWHLVTWRRMTHLAKEYRDFPLYSSSMYVLNSLSTGLPVLLLAHYFGLAVSGAYAFGLRILHAPMALVLRSLRQVLFQRASEANNEGMRLLPLYVKTTGALFVLGAVPTAVFVVWAPQIFAWVFGPSWQTAGEYARSLLIWQVFSFCNLPSVLFAKIIRMQRTVFVYDFVLLATRTLVLVLGGTYLTAMQTVVVFSLVGAAMNIIRIAMVGYGLMKRERQMNQEWRGCMDSRIFGNHGIE